MGHSHAYLPFASMLTRHDIFKEAPPREPPGSHVAHSATARLRVLVLWCLVLGALTFAVGPGISPDNQAMHGTPVGAEKSIPLSAGDRSQKGHAVVTRPPAEERQPHTGAPDPVSTSAVQLAHDTTSTHRFDGRQRSSADLPRTRGISARAPPFLI